MSSVKAEHSHCHAACEWTQHVDASASEPVVMTKSGQQGGVLRDHAGRFLSLLSPLLFVCLFH